MAAGDALFLGDVEQAVCRHALGLPLQLERLQRLDPNRVLDQSVGGFADQDRHRGSGLFEASGRVDRVAGDQVLSLADVPGDHLTGVHSGSVLQAHTPAGLEPLVDAGERLPHRPRGPDRPERVVLVEPRETEHRHDGVADVLLDGAAVAFQHRPHLVEIDVEHLAERLAVEPFPEGR